MKKFYYYIPSLFILFMIFGFSQQNGQESGSLSTAVYNFINGIITLPFTKDTMTFVIRKCAHMTEFGMLALSFYFGMYKNEVKHLFIKPLLLTAFFAACDETHQLFIPGRAGQVQDVLIDTTGAFLFLCALHLILYIINKRKVAH